MNEDKKELMLLELEMIKADLEEILDGILDGLKLEVRIDDALMRVERLTKRIEGIETNERKTIEIPSFINRKRA